MTDAEAQRTVETAAVFFEAEYPARMTSVRPAREAVVSVAERCAVSRRRLDDIRLAVSEATTNATRHAYAHGAPGSFRVSVTATDDELCVRVEDDGCGLSVDPADPGLGLGMSIMHSMASKAMIRDRPGGGTMVMLIFRLDSAPR